MNTGQSVNGGWHEQFHVVAKGSETFSIQTNFRTIWMQIKSAELALYCSSDYRVYITVSVQLSADYGKG